MNAATETAANLTDVTNMTDAELDALLGYEEPTQAELVEDALAAARAVYDASGFGRFPSGNSCVRASLATYSKITGEGKFYQARIAFCGYRSNHRLGNCAQDRAVAAALAAFVDALAGTGIHPVAGRV